jgi:hypothetical protein
LQPFKTNMATILDPVDEGEAAAAKAAGNKEAKGIPVTRPDTQAQDVKLPGTPEDQWVQIQMNRGLYETGSKNRKSYSNYTKGKYVGPEGQTLDYTGKDRGEVEAKLRSFYKQRFGKQEAAKTINAERQQGKESADSARDARDIRNQPTVKQGGSSSATPGKDVDPAPDSGTAPPRPTHAGDDDGGDVMPISIKTANPRSRAVSDSGKTANPNSRPLRSLGDAGDNSPAPRMPVSRPGAGGGTMFVNAAGGAAKPEAKSETNAKPATPSKTHTDPAASTPSAPRETPGQKYQREIKEGAELKSAREDWARKTVPPGQSFEGGEGKELVGVRGGMKVYEDVDKAYFPDGAKREKVVDMKEEERRAQHNADGVRIAVNTSDPKEAVKGMEQAGREWDGPAMRDKNDAEVRADYQKKNQPTASQDRSMQIGMEKSGAIPKTALSSPPVTRPGQPAERGPASQTPAPYVSPGDRFGQRAREESKTKAEAWGKAHTPDPNMSVAKPGEPDYGKRLTEDEMNQVNAGLQPKSPVAAPGESRVVSSRPATAAEDAAKKALPVKRPGMR